MKKLIVLLLSILSIACSSEKTDGSRSVDEALQIAGKNRGEIKKALHHYQGDEKQAMNFLIKYMPERDLKELSAKYLIENIDYAYKAKNEFEWSKNLSDDIFFNEVLPYASLNERRDSWRPDFYNRFKLHVKDSKNIEEAIWAVNNSILKEVNVEYNTDREKPDQSPYESMEQGMASCSGLSILLVDAFRAVGIPARVAGTPNWFNNSGNHNWVEVYVDGKWHFTEYYPSGTFDESWFLERAGKADINNPEQWMYAASFKKTNTSFPLVWDSLISYIYAENVTNRYIELYQNELAEKKKENSSEIQIIMLKNKDCSITGNNRVKSEIELILEEQVIESGATSGPEDDMNRYLKFNLEKDKKYFLKFSNDKGLPIITELDSIQENKQIILYHNSTI